MNKMDNDQLLHWLDFMYKSARALTQLAGRKSPYSGLITAYKRIRKIVARLKELDELKKKTESGQVDGI